MPDSELIEYLREIGLVAAVLAGVAAPFVLWAMVRYWRAGPPVAGAPVEFSRGAYRRGTARPLFGSRLPWVVYAALLASTMGVAFVLVAMGYELWTLGRLGAALPPGAFYKAGVLGCAASRFFLLAAAVAALRRRASAARRTKIATLVTLASAVLYADWVIEVRALERSWAVELVDGAMYLGGLLLTALLVVAAHRAMQRLGRATTGEPQHAAG